MSSVIGISIGTDSLSVSRCVGEKREIAANADGHRTTPTSLSFSEGEVLFGRGAKVSKVRQPTSTVCGLLPLLASELASQGFISTKCAMEIVDDEAHFPTVDTEGLLAGSKKTDLGEYSHTASGLFSAFLSHIRADTIESASGGTMAKSAVLAVPRYMSSSFDTIVKCMKAAEIGEEVRVIYDDIAALSAYSLTGAGSLEDRDVLVMDWGANCLSASILRIRGGTASLLGWKYESGVGGHKLDAHMAEVVCQNFEKKTKIEASSNNRAMRKLTAAMDDVRKTLSVSQTCLVDVEAFCEGVDLKDNLTRIKLESTMRESGWLRTPTRILDALLAEIPESKDVYITDCIFVGGMCRTPGVKRALTLAVQKLDCVDESVEIHDSIPSDEVCALGANVESFLSSLPVEGLRSLHANKKADPELVAGCSRIPTSSELVSKDALCMDIGLVLCAKSALKASGKHFICPGESWSTLLYSGSLLPMESSSYAVAKDAALVFATIIDEEGDDDLKIAMLAPKAVRITEAGFAKIVVAAVNKSLEITVYWQAAPHPVWTPIETITV